MINPSKTPRGELILRSEAGLPEAKTVPAIIAVVCVPKLGTHQAMKLFTTGERFSGAQAVSFGLAHRAVPKDKLRAAAKKNNVILGLFLFGTARVGEFLDKGFPFISLGNDLHHILTQTTAYVKDVESISKDKGQSWSRRDTALM